MVENTRQRLMDLKHSQKTVERSYNLLQVRRQTCTKLTRRADLDTVQQSSARYQRNLQLLSAIDRRAKTRSDQGNAATAMCAFHTGVVRSIEGVGRDIQRKTVGSNN